MSEKTPAVSRALWIGYTLAGLGAFLFSTKSIVIKLAYEEGVDAETLLALRLAIALPIYLAIGGFTLVQERRLPQPKARGKKVVVQAILVGLLGYWFSSYADFKGLEYISVQFARLILFTYPLFVVLFGALFFSQPVRPRALLAFGVSYAGLVLVFTQDFAAMGDAALTGTLWVLSAAVAFALYQLLAREIISVLGARLFTCVAMTAAAVAAIGQYLLLHELVSLSPRVLWLGVVLGIFATVLPTFFMNAALSRISAQANATISTLSPVATIALAVLVLDERLTIIDALGAALVIAGVAFFTLASRPREVLPPGDEPVYTERSSQ